jgi:hypothetical protein
VTVRRHQRDVGTLVGIVRDFSDRQSQLFFLVASFLVRYEPPGLSSLLDVDIADAARALASTFETAARGVIYEHRPASMPAERLATALKPVLLEAGGHGGSAFERDAAVVLRQIADAAERAPAAGPDASGGLIDLLRRMIRTREGEAGDQAAAAGAPRLIVP